LKKHTGAALSNDLSWRNGMLVFDNSTLGEAAAEFNRYNRIRLVIDDPSVAAIPIAGKFPTNGVDRFADVVTHVFGLKVRDSHGVMVISR
jgi:transmembrane sensor